MSKILQNKIIVTILIIFVATNVSISKEKYKKNGKWIPVDQVIAVVNDSPIIKSEVDERYKVLAKKKKVRSVRKEKSRVLDSFIDESILYQTADEESIIISELKIDNHIKKIMGNMRISSMKVFRRQVEKKEKIPWQEYRRQIRTQLLMEQIMAYAIDFTPPSERDARAFYNKNRRSLIEVNVKHILIIPKNSSFTAEKKASKKLEAIRKRILKGESFEKIARKESQGPSASRGGALGWSLLMNLDPYFANTAYQMSKKGQISAVVKSAFGYHIIKYLGRRTAPFSSVKNRIYGILAGQKRQAQFKVWVKRKRRESDIKIYMPNYIKKG